MGNLNLIYMRGTSACGTPWPTRHILQLAETVLAVGPWGPVRPACPQIPDFGEFWPSRPLALGGPRFPDFSRNQGNPAISASFGIFRARNKRSVASGYASLVSLCFSIWMWRLAHIHIDQARRFCAWLDPMSGPRNTTKQAKLRQSLN